MATVTLCLPVKGGGGWRVDLASRHLLPLSQLRAIHQSYPGAVCVCVCGTWHHPASPLSSRHYQLPKNVFSTVSREATLLSMFQTLEKLDPVFPLSPFISGAGLPKVGKYPHTITTIVYVPYHYNNVQSRTAFLMTDVYMGQT